MQIGVITFDGREVGTITFSKGNLDPIVPDLDGYVPSGRASEGSLGGPGGTAHHGHGAGHSAPADHQQRDHGHAPARRERFGGEGDTDPPVEQSGRAERSTRIEPGDRVYGQFAEARDRARAELAEKPWLREKVLRIAANEQGQHQLGTQGVLETMMNRAAVRGTSLEEQAKWHGSERGGYYQRGSMGRGALENPHSRAILNEGLERVLAGSNITQNATDNSSGSLAAREKASGAFRHHVDVNGESFFSPGHAEPALRDRWQRLNWASNTMKAADGHQAKQAEKAPAEKLASGEAAP